jgi:hypothetical protein
MKEFPYLGGYPEQVTAQVRTLIAEGRLGTVLLRKYPAPHDIRTDKALYAYALAIKNASLRQSPPLSKVVFDGKIQVCIPSPPGCRGGSSRRRTKSASERCSRSLRRSVCA